MSALEWAMFGSVVVALGALSWVAWTITHSK